MTNETDYGAYGRWTQSPEGKAVRAYLDAQKAARDNTHNGRGNWWDKGSGSGSNATPNLVYPDQGVNMGLLPGAPYVTNRQQPGTNELIIMELPGKAVARWTLVIRDLSGGADLQMAEIGPGFVPNLVSSSTLDTSHSRTLCLMPKVDTNSDSANLASTWKGALHSVKLANEFNNGVVIGAGSTASKSLFKFSQEDSAGTWEEDFTISPQTFTPPSHITSMSLSRFNSVKQPKILMGFGDDPAKVISGVSGTPTATNMHANTEPCFGAFETGLNSTTPGASNTLLYANNGWWLLSSTAAIDAAPTQTLSNINNGGCIIGPAVLSGAPLRLFYVEPIEDLGKTHMCDTNASTSGADAALGRVRSINFEGLDLQDLYVGLDFVIDAKLWRGGIVSTDGQEVTWHNGQIVNLGFNLEGSWEADAVVSISGLAVIGERLFVMVVERTASTSNLYFFEYIMESNAWYPAFEKHTLADGRWPVFVRETPFVHYFDRTTASAAVHRLFYGVGLTSGDGITQWRSVPLWPRSYNPYRSQTTGNMPRNFAASGSTTLPLFHFPFNGMPMIVSDIRFMGDLKGTDAKLEVIIGILTSSGVSFANSPQKATFRQADDWTKHNFQFSDPPVIDRLQVRFTGTQGSDSTRKTPNFLPCAISGYVFLDGEPRLPAEIEPWRFRGMNQDAA